MQIQTQAQPIAGSSIFEYNVPDYSKLLGVYIFEDRLNIVYEFDEIFRTKMGKKLCFRLVTGNWINEPKDEFEYYKTTIVQNTTKLDSNSYGHTVNITLNSVETCYQIFFREEKSQEELRECKLHEILNN